MILQETDKYTFRLGGKSKILLRNEIENRFEIWIEAEPGCGDLIWCKFNIPFWYKFYRIVSETIDLDGTHVIIDDNKIVGIEI